MYDKSKVIPGLVIFVGIVAFPFFINRVNPSSEPILAKSEGKCVQEKDFIKKEHMKILKQWREEVVREGKREIIIINGIRYEKSLQKTCLQCHKRESFCDRCHSYADVKPYCWSCHTGEK
ncbi:MAG: sulfate reduction electron transfer complex DsrMKJOP subunit DsrJ [bacterium]